MRFLGRKKKKFSVPSVTGRLTSSKHFRDPRSWSSDPRQNSDYLLEAMAQLTPATSREDLANDNTEDNLPDLPSGSELDTLIMKDQLSVAGNRIRTLEKENKALSHENTKTSSEVANLRRFVSDLILHLDYLKSQNAGRRCQMTAEAVERLEKIYSHLKTLSNQIDLIGRVNNRLENVRVEHEKLKQECHVVKKTIEELETEKNQLIGIIEVKERDLSELRARAEEANLAAASASILRERIYARENKISELTLAVDDKAALIAELTAEKIAMTNSFRTKEHVLLKKLENVENNLKDKTEKNIALSEKLQATELLAGDLEILKNQLRVTNKSLEESVENYKRQLEKTALSSQLTAESASKLQQELDALKVQMEQQSKFPQNAKTMLYFAHLNKLIGAYDVALDSEKCDLVTEIKGMIVKLKKEMWGANVLPAELEWVDASVQICEEKESKSITCQPQATSIETQTALPDTHIDDLTRARRTVHRISQSVDSLEAVLADKTTALDEFKRQVLTSLSQDDVALAELATTNEQLRERLALISASLRDSNRLLGEALNEVDNEATARESCTQLLETVLQGTVAEYNNYVQVLLLCLKHSEEKLERVKSNIQSEMELNKTEVESLTNKVEQLSYELANERNTSTELSRQVHSLEAELDKARSHSRVLENRSERYENILHEVAKSLNCDTMDQISNRVQLLAIELQKVGALNADLSGKLSKQTKSTRHMKKILWKNRRANEKLKTRVRAWARKHGKSVRAVKSLKRAASESKRAEESLMDELNAKTVENEEIRARCLSLTDSLTACETRITGFQQTLSNYYEKNAADEVHKVKLERFILKLLKRVKRYKSLLNKKLEDKETITIENSATLLRDELLSAQIDRLKQENGQLSSTIDELRSRLASLFAVDEGRASVATQNDLGDQLTRAATEEHLETVKSHYEGILRALGEDYRAEKEATRRKFADSLRLMKEAAEREVTEVKSNWTREIDRIKAAHDVEMNRMKRSHDEELAREKESLRVNLTLANKQEIDAIKENYDMTIKTKEKEFRTRINERNEQESRNKLEHQLEVDRLKAEMKQEMADAEENHIRAVTRLEQEYNMKMQAVKADILSRKELVQEAGSQTESASHHSQSTCTVLDLPPERPTAFSQVSEFVDIQSIRCEVKSDANHVLSLVPIPGSGDSSNSGILLRKIAELEYKLASSEIQRQKLAMYERQIRLNEMKLNELASLLEQEVQHGQRVHLRLARQFNRSEMLQVEKVEMEKRMKTLQTSIENLEKRLEKEKDKSYSMKIEIDRLKSQPQGSQKLEESLNRLKDKIDQAVECEKRLTEELEKPPADSCIVQQLPERDVVEKPIEQLQVIVIKERATLQTWHSSNIY